MPKPITAEDLLAIQTVLDPRLSPDGKSIAFVVKRVDGEKNKYFTSIWLASVDGKSCRPFTSGDHHDGDPRWSPDGAQILFTSDREGETSQLFVIPVNGGEARKLTDLPEGGLGNASWSPDGKRIVFSYQPADERDTKKAGEERKKDFKSTPPREITRLRFREEGAGWLPAERHHIWVADAKTGKAKQITFSENGEGDPQWSPDGAKIAYVANRAEDPDFSPLTDDIFIIDASGGDERKLDAPAGPKGSLAWSPDGTRIAYQGHTDTGDTWGTKNIHVWTVPVDGGPAVDHTAGLDRSVGDYTLGDVHSFGAGPGGPAWLGNDRLLFIASDQGAARLYSVSVTDNRIGTLVDGNRGVAALSANQDGKCALVIASSMAPAEVYAFDASAGGEPKAVSDLNGPTFRKRDVRAPEEFRVDSGDGQEVHGWILKPPGFDPKTKYPMILEIHGGPHTQYGWTFMHEFQYLAAQGFVVVYSNPRGSQGYGEAWTGAIKGQWGAPDLVDLMAVVDHVLAQGYVDEKRMGVTGGSYGGFMTGWVVGHTERFAAAIADRGVFNLVSMAGTCDFPWDDRYFRGHQWEFAESLVKHSPLTYADKVITPIMLLHSEGDLRCPIEQADQYYAALRTLRKTDVKYMRFPGESNHGLSRGGPPDLRLARLGANLGWMRQYLMKG